jgi:predicted Zn-dependent peptidase
MVMLPAAGRALAGDDPWTDPRKLVYPTLHEIQVPKPDRVVLPNGLVVYFLENHDFPLCDARALMRVGSIYEPKEKIGLASITGEVMRSGGSVAMSGDSLDRRLEGLGASVEINIGDTDGSASVSTLSENFDEGLRILADLLRRPAFPAEKIDLAKNKEKTNISSRNDEMMDILFREFPRLIYGREHPYARTTEYATIDAIAREDLVAFHQAYIHPDRIILTVYGDFQRGKVEKVLRAAFGDWVRSTTPLPPDPQVTNRTSAGFYFANKSDATNTGVVIGQVGMRMDNPDYPAMALLNEILGGGFSSRLFNEIRTKHGLAYATGSTPGAGYHHPGTMFFYAMTQADSTGRTTGYMREEIQKVLAEPVTAEEITRARDAILNSLVFSLSSKGAVLNRLAQYEFYGYPADFLQTYQEAIRKLTPADLLAAAKRNIRPSDFVTMVVGNGDKVLPAVAPLGEPTTIDISIPEPAAPTGEALPPATEADWAKGQALLAAAQKATFPGNATDVKDLSVSESGTLKMQGQELSLSTKTVRVLATGCSWEEQRLPFGVMASAACNNGVGWANIPGRGVVDLLPDQIVEKKQDELRDLLLVLLDPKALEARAIPGGLPIPGAGETKVPAVAVESDIIKEWRILFDPESGRIAAIQYRGAPPMGGPPTTLTETFGDYQPIGNVLSWPHEKRTLIGGEPFLTMKVTEITVNTAPPATLFEKPKP